MTDRIKEFTLTLDKEGRGDDAEEGLNFITMIKHAAKVEPNISTSDDNCEILKIRSGTLLALTNKGGVKLYTIEA